ncbi:MAG: hypothetical protein HGB32_07775 [Geobacteraceae bacterium]|nr:hypothetical protein [Geobacteraceae bacterium]NTW80030.1 hypothetical protein [Geobacteraceae bacterium]
MPGNKILKKQDNTFPAFDVIVIVKYTPPAIISRPFPAPLNSSTINGHGFDLTGFVQA